MRLQDSAKRVVLLTFFSGILPVRLLLPHGIIMYYVISVPIRFVLYKAYETHEKIFGSGAQHLVMVCPKKNTFLFTGNVGYQ